MTIPEEAFVFPTSFSQQRLWFLDQFERGLAFYNIPWAVHLQGVLDVAALQSALDELVARHESLRTTFAILDGAPVQVIAEEQRITLQINDLSAVPAAERDERLAQLAGAEARHAFDLTTGPLFRALLLRLSPSSQVLMFTIHHIIADGWSLEVLFKELSTLYTSYTLHQPVQLPALPIQYADYAQWQREQMQGPVLEAQSTYWTQHLAGAPAVLDLPTDYPRPVVQQYNGTRHSVHIPRPLSEALRALSRREGVSYFMTLLAAFKTLLYRYTQQTDILVGTPVTNRSRRELEGIIGFFVNTVVLRTSLAGNPSFRTLLKRVRETALGAYANPDLPFEQLVELLRPERNLSHTPLFQVMFSFREAVTDIQLPGLVTTPYIIDTETTQFDLTLALADEPEGLLGSLEYNRELFQPATIARLAGHFTTLLEALVAQPNDTLLDLPLMRLAERQQMLVEWNQTAYPHELDVCAHTLIERQVARTPDAPAVFFDGTTLTYAELNARANQLAHHLRTLGVGREHRVGLCVERSLDMIVGLLGILKAGGIYVPLDPSYPKERLALMVSDAAPTALITQQALLDKLNLPNTALVCLERDWPAIALGPTHNPDSGVQADNVAYIIYTSGSTGRPKGVMIEHRALVNCMQTVRTAYALGPHDSVLQFASISFDTSAEEIYPTLAAGARLVLRGPRMLDSVTTFLHSCHAWNLSILNLPTAYWHEVSGRLSTETLPDLSALRLVIVGGERALPGLVAAWQQHFPPTMRLLNAYGLTESTILSTLYDFSETQPAGPLREAPIGRPIRNTRAYVLNERLQPVPIGVPGELYLGGVGLARCYHNQPALTAERFIPDPFAQAPGARMYRSGDLVFYLSDGNLQFLTRIDHQVKIRGFRIELGEIEAFLGLFPGVRENVIVVHQDPHGEKRLVAYVVAEPPPSPLELHNFLHDNLPDYMVPAIFIVLDAWPLTPNGKLDRAALPTPDWDSPELAGTFVAPHTPIAEVLAGVWSELLGLERVGMNDNFFHLGGHSLKAAQVSSRVREALQVDLPLRNIFEFPTLGALAEHVQRLHRAQRGALDATVLISVARTEVLPLSFAQQRLWFLEQLEPGSPTYMMPFAVHIEGALDSTALHRAFAEIVNRHEILRTTYPIHDGQPLQVIAPSAELALPTHDLTALEPAAREAEVQRLAAAEARRPFSLATGPLLRVTLLRTAETRHVLLFTMHHIISDGWSINLLFWELTTLYKAYTANTPPPLSRLPVQYADFAYWQRHWLQGALLEKQVDYWRTTLAGTPPALELATDYPRPAVQSLRGAWHAFTVPADTAHALRRISRHSGTTLFMAGFAAFIALLHLYTQQTDIWVGTPIANRTWIESEALIGLFINTLVLRTDLSGQPSFHTLLTRVREAALNAYAHQDLPFEKLVETLDPERDLSRTPLFQVMFVLQNAPTDEMELPGLKFQLIGQESGTAKFDLTLALTDGAHTMEGTLEYKTDLFAPETIARLATHFVTLLAGLTATPDAPISSLPLLSPAEAHAYRTQWNATTAPPATVPVHMLVAQHAARTPHALAISSPTGALTYQALNQRANQLAHHLRALALPPAQEPTPLYRVSPQGEAHIALLMDHCPERLIAQLAVLKAGATFVPLDPSTPTERLAFLLADCHAHCVLTQPQHLARLLALPDSPLALALDPTGHAFAHLPTTDPDTPNALDQLAYLIYTSGSTGTPKGVAIPHAGLANLVAWHIRTYAVSPADRASQLAGPAFDAAVWEAWPYLAAGASVHIVPDDVRLAPHALCTWLAHERITLAFLPTPLAEAVLAEPWPTPLALRAILTGGDALRRRPPADLPCALINHYGPTEDTVVSTAGPVTPEPAGVLPHIGTPIANTQAYVLDRHGAPVPPGVVGELFVGGTGLARGYFGRPALTAERFGPHPFAGHDDIPPGARLYRTGDLARYTPDGALVFAGRTDDQVKLRGFRIELGEIEAHLTQHPRLAAATVLARADDPQAPNDKRLVAYYVARDTVSLTPHELQSFLKERLPAYMVPSAFVALDQLPLTPNGKVDRRALPPPVVLLETVAYQAPLGEVERIIAEVWQAVLRVERVGRQANFFDLGGHSLLVVQVHARLRERLQRDFPVLTLFKYPTVSALGAFLTQSQTELADEMAATRQQAVSRAQKEKEAMLRRNRALQERARTRQP